MEQAIQKAGRSKYGQEYDIRAEIDRRNGEIRLLRFREVVDAVENEATQMPLVAAQRLNAEAEIGDFVPTRCRPSISAASPRRPQSRSSCKGPRRRTPAPIHRVRRVTEIVNGP